MINQDTKRPAGFPDHLWEGLRMYVLEGRPVGSFLEALCAGNLFEVFRRGDEVSIAGLQPMIMYLENECPMGCVGSRGNVQEWCERGGLKGLQKG